jgi:hypothetical protein
MRRPGRGGTPPKKYGTPTVGPEPQAIDPASGFKVPLKNLVKQWDGQLVDYRYVDRRNSQDFVRGVKDDQSLPYARPETPDTFIAGPLIWQDGSLMFGEDGSILLTQGIDPLDTL